MVSFTRRKQTECGALSCSGGVSTESLQTLRTLGLSTADTVFLFVILGEPSG